jgi:hypothetical protein
MSKKESISKADRAGNTHNLSKSACFMIEPKSVAESESRSGEELKQLPKKQICKSAIIDLGK